MTEQQYRVIADRDKGDDPKVADICAGDRYTMQAERGPVFTDQVVRIERPVPNSDQPTSGRDEAWHAWPGTEYSEREPHKALRDAFNAGWDARHPSVPTREQDFTPTLAEF